MLMLLFKHLAQQISMRNLMKKREKVSILHLEHGQLLIKLGKQKLMLPKRLRILKHSKYKKRHLQMLQLLVAQVELFSLSLVFQLLLQSLLLVVSITKKEILKMLKVVRLMTESFTRAKLPQLTLTRRHKKLLSLTLMYEQDELNFNHIFFFLFLF